MSDDLKIQRLAKKLLNPLLGWGIAVPPGLTGMGAGATFPASPPAGTMFFRTDLIMWAYYDGTRWLSTHEYRLPIAPWQTHTASSAIDHAIRTDYAPWFTRYTVVSVVATTNNGSNFWAFNLQGLNTARSAASGIVAPTTAADTAGTNTIHEAALAISIANRTFVRFSPTVTGAPGALTASVAIYYRLILT